MKVFFDNKKRTNNRLFLLKIIIALQKVRQCLIKQIFFGDYLVSILPLNCHLECSIKKRRSILIGNIKLLSIFGIEIWDNIISIVSSLLIVSWLCDRSLSIIIFLYNSVLKIRWIIHCGNMASSLNSIKLKISYSMPKCR